MRPYVTKLDDDVVPNLLAVVTGGDVHLANVTRSYNDLESYLLSSLAPDGGPVLSTKDVSAENRKTTAHATKPATAEECTKALKSLQGGRMTAGAGAFNWLAILQFILSIINGLIPKPTPA